MRGFPPLSKVSVAQRKVWTEVSSVDAERLVPDIRTFQDKGIKRQDYGLVWVESGKEKSEMDLGFSNVDVVGGAVAVASCGGDGATLH